jgi:hypothetical protein
LVTKEPSVIVMNQGDWSVGNCRVSSGEANCAVG